MKLFKCNQLNVVSRQNGDTALHIAAAMGRRKLTRILLSAGTSLHIKNKVSSIIHQRLVVLFIIFCVYFLQQGEYAVDIAIRKDFHEIVTFLQKPPPIPGRAPREDRDRSKSRSRTKREKTDSGASSKDSGRRSTKPKERKRVPYFPNKSITLSYTIIIKFNVELE